ncbi:RNA-binding protein that suppresses calcineurin deletion Rnc1, variant 2 [Trifolium repens]|nr:RNA-binding protein that suppresses calcineurin deletion Rnc1, variant 2 [Trifolium repens]
MELSSSFSLSSKPCSSPHTNFSFSSSFSPFPIQILIKNSKSRNTSQTLRVLAVTIDSTKDFPQNNPQRLLKELAERKKFTNPKSKGPPRRYILKPPLDDKKLAERFLNSPQLSLKSFPLLSSCLPSSRLSNADKLWIDEYLLEAKQALGYSLEPSEMLEDDNPAKQFDTLLYLAFQHPSCDRTKTKHRYPRESPGPMRERVFGLIGKENLPKWIKAASLQNLIFPYDNMDKIMRRDREGPVKSVFWALFGAIYLCFGLPEVYRVLFEVFGMDPDDEHCQPKLRRQLEDVDYVSAEFENKLNWQDIVAYKPPADALFTHPRLFRACVPPGMHRFRGNIWDYDSRPQVMKILGYPLEMTDRIPEITEARNVELGLGLQLCFLHPSKYKFEHPRFCFERLEYVGQKIQDLVMAERLLMKHLDAPGLWLQEKHRRILMNKNCGRYLRSKQLHRFIIYDDKVQDAYERNRRRRNPATTAVNQAIHGLSYLVYGKRDVRRLMFEFFDFELIQPKEV